jgi:hypothetical protein
MYKARSERKFDSDQELCWNAKDCVEKEICGVSRNESFIQGFVLGITWSKQGDMLSHQNMHFSRLVIPTHSAGQITGTSALVPCQTCFIPIA